MKKLLMTFVGVCAMMLAAVAGDEEVTVKVSVAGDNNSALKKQCEVQGKKAGVKKYLTKMGNDKITEKVIDEAMSSYAKFIEDIEADEQEYEDGEMTCSYRSRSSRRKSGNGYRARGSISTQQPMVRPLRSLSWKSRRMQGKCSLVMRSETSSSPVTICSSVVFVMPL